MFFPSRLQKLGLELKHLQKVAIENYDPFSKASVLSRGIVGDRNGIPKVASPIYKQNFSLLTGECLDDPTIAVKTFPVQVVDGQVQVGGYSTFQLCGVHNRY